MYDSFNQWVQTLTPAAALGYADGVLWLHWCIVMLAVLPVPLFWIGGVRRWPWVRSAWVRGVHLALIGFIVINTLCGQMCPLTVWENGFRMRAGQAGYADGLIADKLRAMLYIDAPPSAFMIAYGAFGALVVFLWLRYPPGRRHVLK